MAGDWRIEAEERTYPMPRRDSHAWFALTGATMPEFFAKICESTCGMTSFADLAIAQTPWRGSTPSCCAPTRDERPPSTACRQRLAAYLLDASGMPPENSEAGSPTSPG